MKEIKSKVQPNPKECAVWIDLKADPHGSIRKHWNGSKWVKDASHTSDFSEHIRMLNHAIECIKEEIEQIKKQIGTIKQYDDTTIQNRVKNLTNKVSKIEQLLEF